MEENIRISPPEVRRVIEDSVHDALIQIFNVFYHLM
jgi:hypothetical protein